MHRERFKSCYSGTDPVAWSSSICLTRGVISYAGAALLRFDDFAPQLDQIAIERRAVQFFFLARDHDGGDAIANQVDERAAGAHEPSIPSSNAMLATGMVGTTVRVATRALTDAPDTPPAPLEVSVATAKMVSCCIAVKWVLVA
jgi:hypothetical protein